MSAVEVTPWDAPGPYEVVFSTRTGGVSGGAYASLNLGLLSGDERSSSRRTGAVYTRRPARTPSG